jgi:hypothetical protein
MPFYWAEKLNGIDELRAGGSEGPYSPRKYELKKGGIMNSMKLAAGILSMALAAPVVVPTMGFAQDKDDTVKQDAKDAGHATKKAAKKTGHEVKKDTKKGVNKSAKKTGEAADKVEDKTQPKD